MFFSRSQRLLVLAFLALMLFLAATAGQAAERVVVPTPPGGGPGIARAAADEAPPYTPVDDPELTERQRERLAARLVEDGIPAGSLRYDDIGGDDLLLDTAEDIWDPCIDIATNGDLYVAIQVTDPTSLREIRVYRSLDSGDSWTSWAVLSDPDPSEQFFSPSLHIAEGVVDKCWLAYSRDSVGPPNAELRVAGSDLALPAGDFSTEITVMSEVGTDFWNPDLTSDSAEFNYYYLYLVARGYEADGSDIWFARCINQGVSFESPYVIAELTVGDRDYRKPDVAYGDGDWVHVAWYFSHRTDALDTAIRYRRAASFAGGGLGAWDPIEYLTSNANGIYEEDPQVAASLADPQVVVAFQRLDEPHSNPLDPGVFGSADHGASFPTQTTIAGGMFAPYDLEHQVTTGDWILGGSDYSQPVLQRSAGADVTTWSAMEDLGDRDYWTGIGDSFRMALDPSRSEQAAFAWVLHYAGAPDDSLLFDAEWRGGPGYPNLEDGFPLDLTSQSLSAPAVVDLDGDSDLEIVFSDVADRIQAFHHNGTTVAGWPQTVPGNLADGPVAIGDLRGDGNLILVAGTTDGRAFAYEADGSLVPGWPFDTGTGADAFVSIGALGGPYPRMVAVCAGDRLFFLNNHGDAHHGFYWSWPGKVFSAPVAIGDVDGDGVAEAVGGASDVVFAVHATEATGVFSRGLPTTVSDAVTLGDLDLDLDVEVVVPTANGSLYVLQGDGSDFAGAWPFVSPTASPLSSAAIADCLGMYEPEIAVAALDWHVHLIYHHGGEQGGYPVETGGWFIYGAPIMGYLYDFYSADVVVGARGWRGWAWDNFGNLVNGWPKYFDDHVYQPPAMGDLDLDGRGEIVFLTLDQLIVLDINQIMADPDETWPMYGYDPQRTGCANCPEDVATDVGPGEDAVTNGITRVSFAQPAPNPIAGQTTFSFALPARAEVRLEIFDLRGRRVATVTQEEAGPGQQVTFWNGRDDAGRALASGQYLARLQVRGSGLDQTLVHKITVLR